MSSRLGPFLVLSLATLALSQEYLIVPNNNSSCHTNTTCFTLDQLAQTDLTNGANLTLIFKPGEHTLTRLLSIRNFTHVQMIGQNTPVLTLHDRGWIKLSYIDQLSIEGLNFTGHTEMIRNLTLPFHRMNIDIISRVSINYCSFYDLDTTSQWYDPSIEGWVFNQNGAILNLRNTMKAIIEKLVLKENKGTALNITGAGSVSLQNSTFARNQGTLGGAVYIDSVNVKVTIENSVFVSNTVGDGYGGAVCTRNGEVIITNCVFKDNSATYGGGIYVNSASTCVYNSTFIENHAEYGGGGIFGDESSSTSINNSILTGNKAGKFGGGIELGFSKASLSNSSLIGNIADYGGGIAVLQSGSAINIYNSSLIGNGARSDGSVLYGLSSPHLTIISTKIVNNTVEVNSIHISQSTLTFLGENTISNNNGPLYAFSSQVYFNGPTVMDNNHGISGGAIQAVQSTVYFDSELTISNNTAEYGGGVFLRESSLFVNRPATISHNTANEGGAIYAYQSTIEFKNTGREPGELIYNDYMLSKNAANNNGGGIYATASIIKIHLMLHVYVDSNTAEGSGGGFYLQQNSKLYIRKQIVDYKKNLMVKLIVSNNEALRGGGIYVNDSTSGGGACSSEADFLGECFIQTIDPYATVIDNRDNTSPINTFIKYFNADVNQSKSAIYGGLLDRCTVSSSVNASNGLDYIKRTVELPADEHSITSDPLQIKLCDSSTSNVSARKGQPFALNVKALDQVRNPVNATIHGAVVTKNGVGGLKEGQVEQRVGQECKELEYNVFSEDSSAQVELYAIGPCNNLGISRLLVTVTFLNCTCPLGFHPIKSNVECSCECDPELQATECFPEEETFEPGNLLWVGAAKFTDCNETGYLVQDCPFDYCVDQLVNISLNSSEQIDRQCAHNRSGVLCGECKEGLSLVFASSKCKKCSNTYLLLLIPFAVAGIALVIFILWLNITVATGTIYGLIFYANVLAANKDIFLPFPDPNFLTVFVSWVNLDFGIETCFYDGMNSQAKVLLQLAFPAYLFFLMFLIIILSKIFNSFAKLISNRNPVAALCTLLIFSYSKLLRLIIAALQFTSLDCSDNSTIVWLYDGNVQYFSPSHIPRFVAASIILTACVLFTTMLFFGQWFPRCSKWKVMKWTKNTKYIGFMDAFHAPFTPKHRYWPGLLLFALIAHNLAATMAPDTSVPVLSAGCVAGGLIAYKFLAHGVHKNRFSCALEILFLLNITTLALVTLTIKNEKKNGQLALAYVSMSLAFILFVVITCYHIYKYVLKKPNIRVWKNKTQALNPPRKINFRGNSNYEGLAVIEDNELPSPVADSNSYRCDTYEETDSDTPQLREPDLDILAPISEEDYRQAPRIPHTKNRPKPVVPSTSIVEIDRMIC